MSGGRSTPLLIDGQTHGAVMQGIGQALSERCVYDEATGQLLSASFMDYAMPRADMVPGFTTALQEVPAPTNPLGVKPGSEGGTAVSPGAVANAIVDALRPLGVRHIELPATPRARMAGDPGRGGAAARHMNRRSSLRSV